MTRSDFNWIPFNHKFTSGNANATRKFPVEGSQIVDDGYILIQVRGVKKGGSHRVEINDVVLGNLVLPTAPKESNAWLTTMEMIPPGTLEPNTLNTITIDREQGDDFEVRGVVVNWRERD